MVDLKFSDNLREALSINEMTQKDLATHLGTTQQTVSRWLKAINEPDLATLIEICLYLKETPNTILGYDEIAKEGEAIYTALESRSSSISNSEQRLLDDFRILPPHLQNLIKSNIETLVNAQKQQQKDRKTK